MFAASHRRSAVPAHWHGPRTPVFDAPPPARAAARGAGLCGVRGQDEGGGDRGDSMGFLFHSYSRTGLAYWQESLQSDVVSLGMLPSGQDPAIYNIASSLLTCVCLFNDGDVANLLGEPTGSRHWLAPIRTSVGPPLRERRSHITRISAPLTAEPQGREANACLGHSRKGNR